MVTLAPIPDATVLAGAPLHIGLDGSDAAGPITYEVTSSNPDLQFEVPEGNDSLRIAVDGFGEMIFELFDDLAKDTTKRIKELVNQDFYDDLIFHRVAWFKDDDGQKTDPFVIQTGDPLGTGEGGSGLEFDDEYHPDLRYTGPGYLGMAKTWDDKNDSQMFVTAGATRFLGFNHSILGFLVEGDDVRAAIQSVEVDDNDKPKEDVAITSAEVFQDSENGVLRLSAARGTTGVADVTVTARDSNGDTAKRAFRVTIQPDMENDLPYLSSIAPIRTTVDTPVEVTIRASDVDGDPLIFGGWSLSRWPPFLVEDWQSQTNPNLAIDVDANTGVAAITPSNGIIGVYGVLVGVNGIRQVDESQTDPRDLSSYWDFQFVPVHIVPPAPTVEFPSSSDTGVSKSDRITSVEALEEAGLTLEFAVTGVFQDAEVTLNIDGRELAQTEISRSAQPEGTFRVVVRVDDPNSLDDGTHKVTAMQRLLDQPRQVGNLNDVVDLASNPSKPLEFTIDNLSPQILSDPVDQATAGKPYNYQVEAIDNLDEVVVYELVESPAGMSIGSNTGMVRWTPDSGQVGVQSATVRIRDLAGNSSKQQFPIAVANQPPVFESLGGSVVAPGDVFEADFKASDPLDPGAEIKYRLESGPADAFVDQDTGHLTWTVPADRGPGEVSLIVRASTDRLPGGDPAKSSTQTLRLTVFDPRLLLLAVQRRPDQRVTSLPDELTLAVALGQATGEARPPEDFAADDVAPARPVAISLTGGAPRLFGTQIGIETGAHEPAATQDEADSSQEREETPPRSEDTDRGDNSKKYEMVVPRIEDTQTQSAAVESEAAVDSETVDAAILGLADVQISTGESESLVELPLPAESELPSS